MIRLTSIMLLMTLAVPSVGAAQDAPKLSTLSTASIELLVRDETGRSAPPQPPRDSRLNGFLIGFAAGAVPGILVGMGIRTYCINEAKSCDAAVPLMAGLFGAAGGGIGYAIDGAIGQSLTFGRPRPGPGVRYSVKF